MYFVFLSNQLDFQFPFEKNHLILLLFVQHPQLIYFLCKKGTYKQTNKQTKITTTTTTTTTT